MRVRPQAPQEDPETRRRRERAERLASGQRESELQGAATQRTREFLRRFGGLAAMAGAPGMAPGFGALAGLGSPPVMGSMFGSGGVASVGSGGGFLRIN